VLLKGMGDAIADNPCPKVFIPSTGVDPEATQLSLTDQVKLLLTYIQQSSTRLLRTDDMLHFVLLDDTGEAYPEAPDPVQMERLGIRVIRCPLVSGKNAPHIDEKRLAPILVSLA
jgi:hypothetical protein